MTAAVLIWLLAISTASAERRVALVIGNEAYEAAGALDNPVSDATKISAALERLGFDVVKGIDLDMSGFRNAVRDFSNKLDGADVALFYYAGHGVQVNGQNFLLPVDATLNTESDLDFATIDVDLILRQMERHPAVKLVFLAACRNNPFEQALTRSMGRSRAVRALGQGLAPIEASGGVMIGFATDPGAVAFDGIGENSPFTEALLKHIETPGLEINVMMTRVRSEVYAATSQRQRPWVTTSLLGEVYLKTEDVPTPSVPEPALSPDRSQFDLTFWESIKDSLHPRDYLAYLDQFPDGVFAWLAKNRIAALEDEVANKTRPAPLAINEEPQVLTSAPSALSDAPQSSLDGGQVAGLPPGTVNRNKASEPTLQGQIRSEPSAIGHSADAALDSPSGTGLLDLSSAQEIPPKLPIPRPALSETEQLARISPEDGIEAQMPSEGDRPAAVQSFDWATGPTAGRRDCDVCPAMVTLTGGTFLMGSPPGSGEAAERPQRKVDIAPFKLSKGEITVGQFAAFVKETGYRPSGACFVWTSAGKMRKSSTASWRAPGYDVTDGSPVACVNWTDAIRYVDWLNEKTNGGYRLASEAEFEFAARAGSETSFFWGKPADACNAVNGAAADSRFRWRNRSCEDGYATIATVGAMPANAFGVTEMIGNLWEWTADCWNGSHRGAPSDGTARTRGSCKSRVLRGGSWDDPLENLRSAYRVGIPANRRQGNVGFRVAKSR